MVTPCELICSPVRVGGKWTPAGSVLRGTIQEITVIRKVGGSSNNMEGHSSLILTREGLERHSWKTSISQFRSDDPAEQRWVLSRVEK